MTFSNSDPFLVTVGDPLVALMPSEPVPLEQADTLLAFSGGAEVNTAVGARRLGVSTAWLGRVGDDPVGRRIVQTLESEGVDTSLVVIDPEVQTGVYLREWLPDGVRRPYYYRSTGGGARLQAGDWPLPWPDAIPTPTILHVTGITTALSDAAANALLSVIERARAIGAVISVDPNFRLPLWKDAAAARIALLELASAADILLLSEDDAALLVDSIDPRTVFDRLRGLALTHAVFKRGARGAVVESGHELVHVDPRPVTNAIDPVGAGDGFNAGFLAALLHGAEPDDAARCGAWCGARAVEHLGECTGYPRRDELPDHLAKLFGDRPVPPVDGPPGPDQ